ncbi:coiled-coil domain-containing protein 173-like isoform X2 [Zootermopsis nevadensis]|uniref:coiled-coil domain-containing protein 173-like isoform X2 n=1 Tax=Zootermopsis nevadensis TaxID=136037 RepID=UPI000B8E9344|nr:coiled-coil domain-containing protein 173-like isoform X2 [Zootermopsis nevadensis]
MVMETKLLIIQKNTSHSAQQRADYSTGEWEQKEALVLEKSEWYRIRGHKHFLNKEAEYAEQQHRLHENLKKYSRFMIKDWENTLQKKKEQRIAANKARLEAIKNKGSDVQKTFRKEQETEKRKYLQKCQQALNYNKDNFKMLNHSLRFSEVLRTRDAQIKFDKKLKALEEKKEQEYADKCRKNAEDYKKETQLEKKRRTEKMNKNKEDLLAQIKEKADKMLSEEKEKQRESEDLINIRKEIEMEEKCKENKIAKKKEIFRQEIEDFLEKQKEFKEAEKHTEEIEKKLTEIYRRSKQKVEQMRKEKEQEILNESLNKKEKIRDYLAQLKQRKGDEENALRKKATAEKEAIAEKNKLKKSAYEQCLKQKRIKAYKEFLAREEQSKKDMQELKKWEIMQRLKENEANHEFNKQRHEKNIKDIEETRKSYGKQIKERQAAKQKASEEEEGKSLRETLNMYDEDKAFLKYIDEIIEDSTKKGRYLYPILNTVQDYKKRYGLTITKKAEPMMKSKILFGPQPEEP